MMKFVIIKGKTANHQMQIWTKKREVQVLFGFWSLAADKKKRHHHTHRDVCPWYTVCPLTLTDVHSFAQTNELLSYVSVCYESVTWSHCAPFPISSFTDYHFAILSRALAVNGQWRTYRRICVCVSTQKNKTNVKTRTCSHPHTGQEQRANDSPDAFIYFSAQKRKSRQISLLISNNHMIAVHQQALSGTIWKHSASLIFSQ